MAEPWKYGRYYWCVKVARHLAKEGEIYLNADEVEVSSDGTLLFRGGKEGGWQGTVLAIAPRQWHAFYSASVLDGHAVAAEHWVGEVVYEWHSRSDRTKSERLTRVDPLRTFSKEQKDELFQRAGGLCGICGKPLSGTWHADHVVPHSAGGRTEIENGMALCPKCNRRKHAKILTVEE